MSSLRLVAPDSSIFQFPPTSQPKTLPPPFPSSTLSAPPFSIPASWYNAALDARVPITIACVYAVSVTILNAYNRSQGNKPWSISKTKAFFWFVVAHNVFLAMYSGWTFWGMLGAVRRTVSIPWGPAGLAGTVDSLCKMHGISGLGKAIAYDPVASHWVSESPTTVLLSSAGTPQSTDLGRLWNEGLAFYGWLFYLSKFYEVLDTAIIIAKGKRSSTLQTYHHAGAMMCMWSGIRYMAAPIWLFVFLNSAIHAMMYTYYTLTAFSVPIPIRVKKSLTTMQIMQFLIGTAYASLHSFVSYTIPVRVPNLATSIGSAATTATTAVASVASSAGFGDLVKKFLFRAAGEEGLAENVHGGQSADQFPSSGAVQYHTEYQSVACVDTSGQAFAIWFNVLYLTPLTFLFARFFVKSYLRRSQTGTHSTKHGKIEKAGRDALKGVEREVYSKGNANGHANGHANSHANGKTSGQANGKH